MGAVWSALLVGGGLAGAIFVWLLRDADKEQKDAPPGGAAGPGADPGGAGGLSPGPSGRELVAKPEHLQESNGCLVSETKGHGNLQEAVWRQQSPGKDSDCDHSREHVPSGRFPDPESLAASETGNSRGYSKVSRNESPESPGGGWGFQKGKETLAKVASCLAEKLYSSHLVIDRAKEVSLTQLSNQDRVDNEDWEMVSRHSSWGDVSMSGSLEAPGLSPNQGMDCGQIGGQEVDMRRQKAGAASSGSQRVRIHFQVHYVPSAGSQLVAITGDHESLGRWKSYIALQHSKDGFWFRSVPLPADTVVAWKFIVVDNGEITRWEECSNRSLDTGCEDKVVQKWWGIP
ncbi:starch-binding domain-containing protein 1 [Lutra lutra]|uniref:starch-binding domain-containing protein 1 n=1 Tax=Lutra lutra TaxID=9657 RepID=UPI001FD51E47|nr:starch-binding domain-containing protein 1 [Lutra lutra]